MPHFFCCVRMQVVEPPPVTHIVSTPIAVAHESGGIAGFWCIDNQFGFGFGDSGVALAARPPVTPRSQTHRAESPAPRAPSTAAPITTPSAPGRSNSADSRRRMPDREASDHHRPLGEERPASGQTALPTTARGLAPVGRGPVVVGDLDPATRSRPSLWTTTAQVKVPVLLLRLREVAQATGLSKNSINRMEAAGRFPQRRQLSHNTVAWSEEDIRAWIQTRPNGRPLRDGERRPAQR